MKFGVGLGRLLAAQAAALSNGAALHTWTKWTLDESAQEEFHLVCCSRDEVMEIVDALSGTDRRKDLAR
jgi:hypothetical protein